VLACDPLRDRGGERAEHKDETRDNGQECYDLGWIHFSIRFASNRSVKSIRSPRSPISRRACCISLSRSSRSIWISSFTPAIDALVPDAIGEGPHEREQQQRRADDRQDGEKDDFFGHRLSHRRKAFGFTLLRHQSFEKIDALAELAELFGQVAHLLHLVPQLGKLRHRLLVVGGALLPADACGKRFADRERASRDTVPPPNSRITATKPTTLSPIEHPSPCSVQPTV